MNAKKYIFILFLIIFYFGVFKAVQAQTNPMVDKLQSVGSDNGPYEDTGNVPAETIAEKIGVVVQVLVSLLGVIFISLTLYAGFIYMTAQGNDEKVSKALSILRQAIIGLIITISSYGIWSVIYNKLLLGK